MTPDPTPAPPQAHTVSGVEAVSVLGDEVRRRLYGFIRRAHRPVTREEAAADAGISAKLAAFHLDKLAAAGLLTSRYDHPGGIRRVGRKPKVYEPADTDIRISIPERRPDLLAEILIDAVLGQQPGEDAQSAALRTARHRGEALGAATRASSRPGRLGPERSLTLSESVLEEHGFEPDRQAPTEVRLLNCPSTRWPPDRPTWCAQSTMPSSAVSSPAFRHLGLPRSSPLTRAGAVWNFAPQLAVRACLALPMGRV